MGCGQPQIIFTDKEYTELVGELSLSPRESQILSQILAGHSDKQIAQNLEIAVPTIRTYLKRLFLKLSVNDKNELICHVFSQFRKGCCGKGCPRRKALINGMTSTRMTPSKMTP